MRRANVEHVELGWKERNGRLTRRMSVKVYVREKRDDLHDHDRLPKSTTVLIPVGAGHYRARRVPVDVVWNAPVRFAHAPPDFLDPVLAGALVGIPGQETGTFACLVSDSAGRVFGVTAGHVVQPFQGEIVAGIGVLQPVSIPPGLPAGKSRTLGATAGGFFGNTPSGFIDFALLKLSSARHVRSEPLDGGPFRRTVLSAATVIDHGVPVTKFGATTGRRRAAFSAPRSSVAIQGIVVFDVLEFRGLDGPFGAPGDSGSLVVSAATGSEGAVVGLLFAVSDPAPDAPEGRAYVVPFERLTGLRPA
ncbi:MAG: hypothetical protein ACREBE_21875 [bacterium]